MKIFLKLIFLFLLIVFLVSTGYSREEGLDKTGKQYITQTDINILVDNIVNDLISSGKLTEKPKIALFRIGNKTKDHIDGEAILNQIGNELVKGEVATIVERAKLVDIAKEQSLSQALSKKSDAIKTGKIAGANYILHGQISQNDPKEAIKSAILVLKLSIILTDSETSEDVWSSFAEVKKKVSKDFARWLNKY